MVSTVPLLSDFLLEELAKEGIPFPFGNEFWASNWPTGKSPLPGLILHFIPSVSFASTLYISPFVIVSQNSSLSL